MKNGICCVCGITSKYSSMVGRYRKDGKIYCSKHKQQIIRYGYVRERTMLTKNEIVCRGGVCTMNLYDQPGNLVGKTLFSERHIDRVRQYKWSTASSNGKRSYVVNSRSRILLHKFLSGALPGEIVDHINRDTFDNRDENLRLVNWSQNGANKSTQSNNKSGYPGIDYDEKNKKWKVRINFDKKTVWLGRFSKYEDALLVRKTAERIVFGKYAPIR